MSDDDVPGEVAPPGRGRRWYVVALATMFFLVLVVVAFLPIAVRSMVEVLGRGPEPLYDFLTGDPVTPDVARQAATDAIYVNMALVDLEEVASSITLAVSGNRSCAQACRALDLTFVALNDTSGQRQGLPPSATLKLASTDRLFSQEVQLPIRGQPSLYPFDTYQLRLGVAGTTTRDDGTTEEITPTTLTEHHAVMTLQNQVLDMIMAPPEPIDPESVGIPADPFHFLAVQSLNYQQPAYLKVLAVVLILLVAVSATLALFTRSLDELALGFGGIVLGVWGVRSILMPQSVGTVTAVDLALSWLILLLLLGLSIRAILHFHSRSELRLHRLVMDRDGSRRAE